MRPICLVPGPNSTKFTRADRMDFSPLANPNIFKGSNFLRKMGWNYLSGALCLKLSCHNLDFDREIPLDNALVRLSQTKSCSRMTKKAYVAGIRSELENKWPVKHKRFHIKKSITRQIITFAKSTETQK